MSKLKPVQFTQMEEADLAELLKRLAAFVRSLSKGSQVLDLTLHEDVEYSIWEATIYYMEAE